MAYVDGTFSASGATGEQILRPCLQKYIWVWRRFGSWVTGRRQLFTSAVLFGHGAPPGPSGPSFSAQKGRSSPLAPALSLVVSPPFSLFLFLGLCPLEHACSTLRNAAVAARSTADGIWKFPQTVPTDLESASLPLSNGKNTTPAKTPAKQVPSSAFGLPVARLLLRLPKLRAPHLGRDMDAPPRAGSSQGPRETGIPDAGSREGVLIDGSRSALWTASFRAVVLRQDEKQGPPHPALGFETDRIILPPSSLDAILNLPSSFTVPSTALASSIRTSPERTRFRTKPVETDSPDDEALSDDEDEEDDEELLPARQSLPSAIPQSSASVRRELPSPLNFQLANPASGRITHAGVKEFSAEEGTVQLQPRTAAALGIEANGGEARVVVRMVILPKATGAKFRPLSKEYV
ncbi:MAG: hypothetical protein BJ554DRAFT_933 [Olpidium bornovanus]|uniref:Ubiquitin fusion degradation protein UFD1 N-terminal subdomain 1 domain-containing protein n=1 Tax=Olpidium bornovanus TaxID=278681 RepID=A0A8H8DI74_9FUNG|nr:MAG: hypothetical protein BJ554DRAFT_933 [Olpidium bornovanus]